MLDYYLLRKLFSMKIFLPFQLTVCVIEIKPEITCISYSFHAFYYPWPNITLQEIWRTVLSISITGKTFEQHNGIGIAIIEAVASVKSSG